MEHYGKGYWFKDEFHAPCTLKESSTYKKTIWLGVSDTTDGGSKDYGMYLSQDKVKYLLPILEYFAENGELPS